MKKAITGLAVGATLVGGGTVVATQPPQEVSIRDQVLSAKVEERRNIKATAIMDTFQPISYTRDGIRITISRIDKIDGGVAVFASAKKGNTQLGFGDGTVETERFKVYNPPVLVADPSGDIVIESYNPILDITDRRTYREDPREALLQVIAHNVKLTINGTSPKKGRVGRTVTTVYPDAHTETTSTDGFTIADPAGLNPGTWANLIGLTDSCGCITADDTSASSGNALIIRNRVGASDSWKNIGRTYLLFDTSSIPDADSVSVGTLSFKASAKQDDASWAPSITIADVTTAANTSIATGDHAKANFGSTEFASRYAYSSISTSAYNDITLNASGLSHIDKTGITPFGLRWSYDFDESSPSVPGGDSITSVTFVFADTTGTTDDPKLVITHGVSGSAAASLLGDVF